MIDIFKAPKSQIVGAIRRVFSMSALYKHVKGKALSEEVGVRGGKQCVCSRCGGSFPWSKCSVDHFEPVIEYHRCAEDMTYDEIINRMWCAQSNLNLLCSECHELKTQKIENPVRREAKKMRKNGVSEEDILEYVNKTIKEKEEELWHQKCL